MRDCPPGRALSIDDTKQAERCLRCGLELDDDEPEHDPDWYCGELTQEEKNAIATLKRLAKRWPSELWVFAANGEFTIMHRNEKGERAMKDEGVDRSFIVDMVEIPCDGGDW